LFFFLSIANSFIVHASHFSHTEEKKIKLACISVLGYIPEKKTLDKMLFYYQKKELDSLNSLFLNSPHFYKNLEDKSRYLYLNGVSRKYMIEKLGDFFYLYSTNEKDSLKQAFFFDEYKKLEILVMVATNSKRLGKINGLSIYKSIFDNAIYREINMGTFNYVVSLFENLYNRKPTQYEIEQSISILENNQGILFGKKVNRDAYLETILFNFEFIENQLKLWYSTINMKNLEEDKLIEIISNKNIANIEEIITISLNELWAS